MATAESIRERWNEYEASLPRRWLARRDAEIREILDGNREAFDRLRRGRDIALIDAQKRIVESLESIERRSGSVVGVVKLVLEAGRARLRARERTDRPLRILEVGAGWGWMQHNLWERARQAGLDVELAASDLNPELVRTMEDRFRREGVPCTVEVADARAMSHVADGAWDLALVCYTLHHLPPWDVAACLAELDRVSAGGMVVIDLARHPLTLLLGLGVWTTLGWRAVPYGVHDGTASVRRAYTVREMELLLEWVGLADRYQVSRMPTWHPQRLFALALRPR